MIFMSRTMKRTHQSAKLLIRKVEGGGWGVLSASIVLETPQWDRDGDWDGDMDRDKPAHRAPKPRGALPGCWAMLPLPLRGRALHPELADMLTRV